MEIGLLLKYRECCSLFWLEALNMDGSGGEGTFSLFSLAGQIKMKETAVTFSVF
jgi:hypothetical protein